VWIPEFTNVDTTHMSTPQPLHFNAVSFSLFMTLLPTSGKKKGTGYTSTPIPIVTNLTSPVYAQRAPLTEHIYTQIWVCASVWTYMYAQS